MPRPKAVRPTDAELEILRVLWDRPGITIGRIHRALQRSRRSAYTTVQTMLRVMSEKGLVVRDTADPPATYRAAISERDVQRKFVRDLLDRLFQGSTKKFVMHVLSSKKTSKEDLAELRRRLDELQS